MTTSSRAGTTIAAPSNTSRILLPPTTSLPPLGRLPTYTGERVKQALQNLRSLYVRPKSPPAILASSKLALPKRTIHHPIHDKSVPDSGYASAEDDNEENEMSAAEALCSDEEDEDDTATQQDVELLRADALERSFSIKWITGFIARADDWTGLSNSDDESAERAEVLEEAIILLSAFTGNEDEDEIALTRTFTFPNICCGQTPEINARKQVHVELNDAPLSKDDHTSVGLQSWGSSIILADRLCLDPSFFSLLPPKFGQTLRILELGAGTGMLSIVASKILPLAAVEIVATDYHPEVLGNLSQNITTNFPSSQRMPIDVLALDWEHPSYGAPLDKPFDIILAADVVYHPSHAKWIKNCVERLLARPRYQTVDQPADDGGVFWLIIPVRTTGRHEGMDGTVDTLFPDASSFLMNGSQGGLTAVPTLAVLYREEHGRQGNVGRADEGAYKLFKIGWV